MNQVTMEKWLEQTIVLLTEFGKKIVIALLVFLVGKWLIKHLLNALKKSFARSSMEEGLSKFLLSFIKIALNVVLIFLAVSAFDITSASIMAVLGSAGLTVGLALQGSLSNFAGGVLILIMKPFQIGDYIVTGANEGTVTGIDIFYTHLLTIDNKRIVIPNGGLSNSSITNVTREPVRRIDLLIPISYGEDIDKVRAVIFALLEKEEMILPEYPKDVFVDSFANSSVSIGCRIWTATENYWKLKWKLLENIKKEFDRNNITIPFEQLDVTLVQK